ncbi:Transcription factor, fungi [Penicillium italicum]|uniref:Transcription factor, fungi n=1 Tax=Penicillium italicum TaxID=40296 RepID=A0A0A2L333_PENIT|nr:Transcription factor, fungi [Penicillium italicum]
MGLSFLQGTFLMAQVDFADGKARRAYASVALGLRAIQSVGLNQDKDSYLKNDSEIETRKRVTWAFFMLDRTYSASRNYSLSLSDKQFTLPFPALETEALLGDNGSLTHGSLHDGPGKQGQKVDHGILVCLLRLYSLWGKSTEYVFEPFTGSSLPPWQTGSALAILESEWLQFETHFADAHRYINVDFKSRAREDPQPRTYLSTWVCVQFLFHSIQGLLHHPFVIMTKLRNFDGNISATFLQKSFETSLLHSRWIVRFIREMSDVNFETCDPFLGYLAAIAATIQLEHTGSKNPQIALLLNKEFRILVDFMTELSVYWENMGVLVSLLAKYRIKMLIVLVKVNKVNELAARHQNYGSLYYNQEGFSGALSKMPTPSNMPRMSAEDEGLMWEILDFGCSSGGDKAMTFGNLALPQDIQANRGHLTKTRTSSRTQRVVRQQKNDQGGRITPSVPNLDEMSESIIEGPSPEWPFQTRGGGNMIGAAMPDIPDWMILEDYMTEHL